MIQLIKSGLAARKDREFDCDASAILLTKGKIADRGDIVYYDNLNGASGAVRHMGDNVTGAGDGDNIQIMIDLTKVPAHYDQIIMLVNIYQAAQRKQNFGMIANAFCRIAECKNDSEVFSAKLTDEYGDKKTVVFAEATKK